MNLYARFTRNIAWCSLAFGGLYIVGGIAQQNAPLFEQLSFLETFLGSEPFRRNTAKQFSIYVVTDNNVGLYGAAQYLLYELE